MPVAKLASFLEKVLHSLILLLLIILIIVRMRLHCVNFCFVLRYYTVLDDLLVRM